MSTDLALCLSGGGLRATYFHLGVIWGLRKLQRLQHVKIIYCVSGGSIIGAHLALHWSNYIGSEEDAAAITTDLLQFATRDVRGRVVRRFLLSSLYLLPLFDIFFRAFSIRFARARTDLLEREYSTLFGLAKIRRLRVQGGPDVHVLATSMLTGDLVDFSSKGIKRGSASFGGEEILISRALASSSAFPPLFPPLKLHRDLIGASKLQFNGYDEDLLSDGGLFDNLGYHPLVDTETTVILSDAGASFDVPSTRWFWSVISRTSRAIDILMKRLGDESLKSIARARNVTIIRIGKRIFRPGLEPTTNDNPRMAPESESSVARFRTDLDVFTPTETAALIINGYRNCIAALARSTIDLEGSNLPFLYTQNIDNSALLDSAKRRLLSFNKNDWTSYFLALNAAIAISVVCFLVLSYVYIKHENHLLISRLDGVTSTLAALNVHPVKLVSTEEQPVGLSATDLSTTWSLIGSGDCGDHDIDRSEGPDPVRSKCSAPDVTAVCWDDLLFKNGGTRWCTYKRITATSCVGGASPGRVFRCIP